MDEKITIQPEEPKQIETLEKQLGREYEEKNPDLRQVLAAEHTGMFERLKGEYGEREAKTWRMERDKAELERENNELNEDVSDLVCLLNKKIDEYRDAIIDSVTGLEQRKQLFKRVNTRLAELLGVEASDTPQEVHEKIRQADFSKTDLAIMMGDISFLSLANESAAGHSSGDKLLSRISRTVSEQKIRDSLFIKAYRHGGDEITAILDLDQESVGKKLGEIQDSVNKLENIDNLAAYGLKPNIDMGSAQLSEAKEVLDMIEQECAKKNIRFEQREIKDLANVWLQIADRKCFINKADTRIRLLADKYKNDPVNFKKTINSLRKGGYNIEDKELDGMAKSDKLEEDIPGFIRRKDAEKLNGMQGYDLVRAKVINDYVWGKIEDEKSGNNGEK